MSPKRLATVMVACALAAACLFLSSGCYWSTQPSSPHRTERLDLRELTTLVEPTPRALSGGNPVVLGRFDSTAPSPIGGLYDRRVYTVSSLQRTFFFKDGPVEIFEHVADGLRASGLVVLKDYVGHAEPSTIEPGLRAKHPVLVRATVMALQHDQIRNKGEPSGDFEAGVLFMVVTVTDDRGAEKFSRTFRVAGRIPYDGQTDFLRLLGWKLAETLSLDDSFVAAIGAKAARVGQ